MGELTSRSGTIAVHASTKNPLKREVGRNLSIRTRTSYGNAIERGDGGISSGRSHSPPPMELIFRNQPAQRQGTALEEGGSPAFLDVSAMFSENL